MLPVLALGLGRRFVKPLDEMYGLLVRYRDDNVFDGSKFAARLSGFQVTSYREGGGRIRILAGRPADSSSCRPARAAMPSLLRHFDGPGIPRVLERIASRTPCRQCRSRSGIAILNVARLSPVAQRWKPAFSSTRTEAGFDSSTSAFTAWTSGAVRAKPASARVASEA